MRGSKKRLIAVQSWQSLPNVSDPLLPSRRQIIKGGGFSPVRHQRDGGFQPASNRSTMDSMWSAMDSINYVQEAPTAHGGVINAQMSGTVSTNTLPRVTYSSVSNQSKSYSPGTLTGGATGKLGG